MLVYQEKARARIKENVSAIRSQCKKGIKTNMGEADTRAIVRRVLIDCLGWDEFSDVTQEEAVKGGYCDYMVRHEGRPYFVVEVKKVSGGLRESHLMQASAYAQNKGLQWVLLTNGDEWQAYNLYYVKKRGANPLPELFHVFTTSFTDTNIPAPERIELLYLLSKEACKKNELGAYHERLQALSPQNLVSRILRKDVIDRIRIGIKNDIDYKIENAELAERLLEVFRDEAVPPNVSRLVKKLK
jgi:predicted type IV restriction endonuclease